MYANNTWSNYKSLAKNVCPTINLPENRFTYAFHGFNVLNDARYRPCGNRIIMSKINVKLEIFNI